MMKNAAEKYSTGQDRCGTKTANFRIIHEMDIQEPEFTSEQVRSVLFTQDAGNQCETFEMYIAPSLDTGTLSARKHLK